MSSGNPETKETPADSIMRVYREHFSVVVRRGWETDARLEVSVYQHGVSVMLPPAHARIVACDLFVASMLNGGSRESFNASEIEESIRRVQEASR